MKKAIVSSTKALSSFVLSKLFPVRELPGVHLQFMRNNYFVEKQLQQSVADKYFCFAGQPRNVRK